MSIFVNCLRKMTGGSNENEVLKGYKVTNVDRTRRFGVACRDLQELKRKGCAKLNIPKEEQEYVTVCLVDGSLIDDEYFLTLEPQTILILRKKGEKLLSDADILYNTLRQVNLEFITTGDAVSKFLSANLKSKIATLNKALQRDDSKTLLSARNEHPEWFKNLDTTANTKEAYMHRRCQDRFRGYLYKTIDQIKNSEIYAKNEKARHHLTHAIAFFKLKLKQDHCLGFYFDRSYAKGDDSGKRERPNAIYEGQDESDDPNSFICRYDHCPCRIGLVGISRHNKNIEDILSEFLSPNDEKTKFDEEADSDETDTRTMHSPAKKLKDNDDSRGDGLCPYKIERTEDRTMTALCDANGEFKCAGVWNAERCGYSGMHCINPYRSYEELVLFSTWNFDHRIERSRTLIPNLLKASEQDAISQRDIRIFYDNIFTVKNLRLVHIICHDKGAHKQRARD